MERKGITNPDSQDVVDLCLNCPYDKCELDNIIYPRTRKKSYGIERAKKLKDLGFTIKEIAIRMDRSIRTIERYLK